jgi:hypothetical protein
MSLELASQDVPQRTHRTRPCASRGAGGAPNCVTECAGVSAVLVGGPEAACTGPSTSTGSTKSRGAAGASRPPRARFTAQRAQWVGRSAAGSVSLTVTTV